MNTVLSDATRVARKPHRCWYCGEGIAAGERYRYRTGISDGDFWQMHAHPECDAYAAEHWGHDDYEGHEPSEFQRPPKPHEATHPV